MPATQPGGSVVEGSVAPTSCVSSPGTTMPAPARAVEGALVWDRFRVGRGVGRGVEYAVGRGVGADVGFGVGFGVGATVGTGVGATVGAAVGVGFGVGFGFADGRASGASVAELPLPVAAATSATSATSNRVAGS